jgi:hypothetical protein
VGSGKSRIGSNRKEGRTGSSSGRASGREGITTKKDHRLMILRAENETRTRDPNLGKVVLYQLSYFRVLSYSIIVSLRRCKSSYKFHIYKST